MSFKRTVKTLFNHTFRRKQIDLKLNSMSIDVRAQTAKLYMEHPAFVEFITTCTEMFDKSGAINYLELQFFSVTDMREFEVLIKPVSGMRPGTIVSRLRYALEKIADGHEDPIRVAQRALSNCGYTEPMTEEAIAYLRHYFPYVGGDHLD